jgi:hypothetical protein
MPKDFNNLEVEQPSVIAFRQIFPKKGLFSGFSYVKCMNGNQYFYAYTNFVLKFTT